MAFDIDIATQEGMRSTLEGILGQIKDTQTAVAKLAGPGLTTEIAMENGVGAFRTKNGGLRLADAKQKTVVKHDDETYIVEATVPGLFSKGASDLLGADEKAAVDRYRSVLGKVNACAQLGLPTAPSEWLGQLITFADAAPASLRTDLATHARSVAAGCEFAKQRHGKLASSSANTSGNPGYGWVADAFLPDVLDITDPQVGLYDIAVRGGMNGLHQTAALKVRIMTDTGGMRVMGRQLTDTIGSYPKATIATSEQELTGGRAVHATLIDGLSTRDPREAVDWLMLHQRAGAIARLAAMDFTLLHGDKQTAPASHAYAVAGLTRLKNLDHRDTSSGDATDFLLLADGLRTMAVDRSATVDLGTALSGAANVWSSQANALTSYLLLRAELDDQYKRGSVLIVTQTIADTILKLGVGVNGTPFAVPYSDPSNPFVVGRLYDGTLIVAHYGVSKFWSTGGVVDASGTSSAAYLANLSVLDTVTGPDDGRTEVKQVVDGDATLVVTYAHRVPWLPLPTTKNPVAFGYNF